MNPISVLTLSAFVLLLSAWRARAAREPSERRWVALVGVSVALFASLGALFWVIEGGGQRLITLGGLHLIADRVTFTLAPVLSLGMMSFVMALPRRELGSRALPRALILLALSLLSLIAGDLVSLAVVELLGGLLVASVSRHPATKRLMWVSVGVTTIALLTHLIAPPTLNAEAGAYVVSHSVAALLFVGALIRLGAPLASAGLVAELSQGLSASHLALCAPLGGVMTLLRVLHPHFMGAQEVAHALMIALLGLSLLWALSAIQQTQLSKSLAYVISASHGVLIVGLLEPSEASFVGGEVLWSAVLLAELGLLLVYALTTSRVGVISLKHHHGLQQHMPLMARASLLLSLSLAASPGSMDFIGVEMLLSGEVTHSPVGALLMAAVLSAIAFALMRAHFRVFFGPSELKRGSLGGAGVTLSVEALPRERSALTILLIALLIGGLAPSLLPLLR